MYIVLAPNTGNTMNLLIATLASSRHFNCEIPGANFKSASPISRFPLRTAHQFNSSSSLFSFTHEVAAERARKEQHAMPDNGKLRWGIAGCGRISNDFVAALTTLPSGEHEVAAVAARDRVRSEEFAKRFGIPKVYHSYEALAEDDQIDVIYIGTVNSEHTKLCKQMLHHKKHVLCEKPLTLRLQDTKDLFAFARQNGKFLMEAIWTRTFPAYKQLKSEIEQQTIGDVQLVTANFGCNAPNVPSLAQRNLGGGVLLNVGCYMIQLATLVFPNKMPTSIKAAATLNDDGVDETTAITLQYEDGAIAQFLMSTRVELDSAARIVGSEGTIEIEAPFLAPTQMLTPSGKYHFVLPFIDEKFPTNFINSAGLSYEAAEVRRCILAGELECPWMTHADSILDAEIIEKICKEIKVNYD
ncbi:Trans-1,2-dihydrobenzene-1,2-diol dehydrogenase [Hypsibius exemplaris]|uniref:Trans-1,2-dihydrobenzene-1,2-diol dehydrogenase n=1 Tax=Hypsibius exemplaris TaxID=2072580 RepID=A0A1W0XCA2_HYPEX|nr:Trans-1,2-dihydrobenzene-1,2-diol dehydrogenase [Hypsibius exemplaris]